MKTLNMIIFLMAFSIFTGCVSNSNNNTTREETGDNGVVILKEGESHFAEKYKQASDFMNEKNYAKAEQIYYELLKLEHDKKLVWIGLGSVNNLKGNYLRADSLFSLAIGQDHECYACYLGLAGTKFLQGYYKEALKDYQTSHLMKPDMADPYYGLAISYDQLNQIDSAKFYAGKFIERSPGTYLATIAKDILDKK